MTLMASWKEKGVVPDSEDDEDSLDSQSIVDDADQVDQPRNNDFHEHNDTIEKGNKEQLGETQGVEDVFSEKTPVDESLIHHLSLPAQTLGTSKPDADNERLFLPSSPSSPQIFKVPRALSDGGDDLTDSENETGQNQDLFSPNSLPVEDEISKSYVRLTSLVSNLLSSFPAIQQEPTSNVRSNIPRDEASHGPLAPSRLPNFRTSTDEDITSQTSQRPANIYKRALRERAPIQLHPYAMEQEKYRRTLKARGMTPMRLAQTQEEAYKGRDVTSSTPNSQDLDSQEVEQETEESQPMDFSCDSEPLSPRLKTKNQVLGSQSGELCASNDDDEFPDIDELLLGHQSVSQRAEPKHPMKVYSSKRNRSQLFQIQTVRTESPTFGHKAATGYDIPASPPATSPPFPPTARRLNREGSQAVSVSSEDPTPSWFEQDRLSFHTAPDLPTPATSAIKPTTDTTLLESDLDDDPFASETSYSTSSDESIQVRQIGKKIRGVLPASHLRLDQQLKKQKVVGRAPRYSLSVSPRNSPVRRGVALSRGLGVIQVTPSVTDTGLQFISDDSEDDESDENRRIMGEVNGRETDNIFPQNRMGYAKEEDKIDAMLPSLKRQQPSYRKARKRIKLGSSSLSRNGSRGYFHQPKIIQHLSKGKSAKSYVNRLSINGNSSRKTHSGAPSLTRRLSVPRLSIADLVDHTDGNLPQFIKIAARTARSKNDKGRQSPSKKFIRLSNREDTFDAHSVLEEWKQGRIKPGNLGRPATIDTIRSPLGPITGNRETSLQLPVMKSKSVSQTVKNGYGHLDMPRQLVVSKREQISLRDFISKDRTILSRPESIPDSALTTTHHVARPREAKTRYRAPQSRPAQLESSEVEYSHRSPTIAFNKTKIALDALFRSARKRPVQQQNLQLNRFLADGDIVRPSIEAEPLAQLDVSVPKRLSVEPPTTLPRQRKRLPQRIDIGAARYRQPSEPLVLDLLALTQIQDTNVQDNKLTGLSKFGVRYPSHFDIFPLQSGIFFHESTFIGSGQLSEAIKVPVSILGGVSRPRGSFRLGDKDFRWGQWDEDVSSDIGLFFDCLFEQLVKCTPSPYSSDCGPAGSMAFVINFMQHHISFTNPETRFHFLSRMLEVLQDFSSRVSEISPPTRETNAQPWIDTMARCTVLVMQLLQMSRAVQSAMTFKIEDLLKGVASLCVKLLVHQGLDGVRKLYDDLQYLSFRERGIRNDQYIAHAWVVVLKVLNAARIPNGSFWDVTNTQLPDVEKNIVDDARIMDQIWYSVFSLLPLCEFDEFGVLVPGVRQRSEFENWLIPQCMLKRIFMIYSTNPRQSPGFNDYCRALVSRCHFLMKEWGWWKCGGIIGTLFDFFASQKLSHLRNEEVYRSPRFLEELDAEPSLNVQPEDRCFHIFLKIVSLAIKRLRQVGDVKGVRNLVARLLPNHDRQYPKEDAIHQRELAALRNHHDLLCTLYWASPPESRPSLNLIQELVVADHSHKEACLISLRAWGNLARYFFTSANETETQQQLIDWQYSFFDKLLHQYLDADSEVRRQAELLPVSGEVSITESQLQKTIDSNRISTMATIQAVLSNLRYNIDNAKDATTQLKAINTKLLCKILNPGIFGIYRTVRNDARHEDSEYRDISDALVGSAISILGAYMRRVNDLHPLGPPLLMSSHTEFDSQESLDLANVDFERQMLIFPLYEYILPNFAKVTRDILESRLYQPSHRHIDPSFMEDLVACWARLVSLVTEEKYELRDFIIGGPNAVFENRQRYPKAKKYWPLFLSQLLKDKEIEGMKVVGFDIGLEWMQVVISPPQFLEYEPHLSCGLYQRGHYLLKSDHELKDFAWLSAKDDWPLRHRYLVQVAAKAMRNIKMDPNYGNFAEHNKHSEREIQGLFSATLRSIMDSMQQQLESFIPSSNSHIEYVKFCQDITSYLRAYTNNIRPLTEFFVRQSNHYWPKGDDPHLYAAGIVSYSLQLHEQRSKAPFELFYYIYNGWKNDLLRSRLNNHVVCVLKGMKHWPIAEFMLANFVPAIILVGFNTRGGHVLPRIYLPALAKRVPHFLQQSGPEGASTFTHLINILKMVINGISAMVLNASDVDHIVDDQEQDEDGEGGLNASHCGIISVTLGFWIAIQPALMAYVGNYPVEMPILDEVTNSLNDFQQTASLYFANQTQQRGWEIKQLEVTTGEYVDRFVVALKDDIEKNWVASAILDPACVWVKVPSGREPTARGDPRGVKLSLGDGIPSLHTLLKRLSYFNGLKEEFLGWQPPADDYAYPVKKFPGVFHPRF